MYWGMRVKAGLKENAFFLQEITCHFNAARDPVLSRDCQAEGEAMEPKPELAPETRRLGDWLRGWGIPESPLPMNYAVLVAQNKIVKWSVLTPRPLQGIEGRGNCTRLKDPTITSMLTTQACGHLPPDPPENSMSYSSTENWRNY